MTEERIMSGRTYIELFAGCGGLSLGLSSTGLELELANELSSMAAETYAYNLLGEDLSFRKDSSTVLRDVSELEEIPIEEWQSKKLIVGDVVSLVDELTKRKELLKRFEGLDLISGGPPCQGFSMAGKRKERDPKNRLPYAFVDLVGLLKPKVVLLENVEGILRQFKSDGGVKKPWLEIAKAFAAEGYAPICFMLNARHFGVPQNRPRFVLLGLREDLRERVLDKLKGQNDFARSVYECAFDLANQSRQFVKGFDGDSDGIRIQVVDSNDTQDKPELFSLDNLFPQVVRKDVSAEKALDDLKSSGVLSRRSIQQVVSNFNGGEYSERLRSVFGDFVEHPSGHKSGLHNHELRNHGSSIKLRFKLIQVANELGRAAKNELEDVLKGRKEDPTSIAIKLWSELSNDKQSLKDFGISNLKDLENEFPKLRSKKHIQRSLIAGAPAPAQVTIPDDLCHYDRSQPRVLSVREMARIQSFPDEFVFRSKVTTGGMNRKSEVPQYTQVGNAVPPLLGRALGELVNKILS